MLKTLDRFDWYRPTKINRLLIQNLLHLDFVANNANVVRISGTGLDSGPRRSNGLAPCESSQETP